MHKNSFIDGLVSLLTIWKNAQKLPQKVLRWGKYIEADDRLRKQNNLQHCFSVLVAASIFLPRLGKHIAATGSTFDQGLVLRAFTLHEEGEAILERDVLWDLKSGEKDLEEYLAFMEAYCTLPAFDLNHAQKAFLLQFARKNPECFPPDARRIMAALAKKHLFEALAFEAIETVDYLLYALECFDDLGDEVVLCAVLDRQIPRLNEFANLLPGFRETIWTAELQKACEEKLAAMQQS